MALGFVRPARPAEAGEIARIQLATWRVAYRRMLPRRVLDQVDEGFLATRWAQAITAPPSPRHRVLVAVEQSAGEQATEEQAADERPDAGPSRVDGPIAGFIAAGPADEQATAPGEPALPDSVVAVTDLLVEPRWGRRGHGSRLLSAAVTHWRSDGFGSAVAWAYEADTATRGFLDSAGWRPDGAARALDIDDLLVNQVRLHVAL